MDIEARISGSLSFAELRAGLIDRCCNIALSGSAIGEGGGLSG